MCNNCNCENYEKCSIVGNMNFGSCCHDCFYFDEMHSCEYYIFAPAQNLISEKVEFEILQSAFCMKMDKTNQKIIELFP